MMRNRIIDASVQLFTRQGYKATTTRDIARLAGINESSIFRHFPRKEDVFWAALHSRIDRLRLSNRLQVALEGGHDPSIVLPMIVEFVIDIAVFHADAMKLVNICLLEMPINGEVLLRGRLGPIFDSVALYFERSVSQGILKRIDPRLAAIGLISTILADQGMNCTGKDKPGPYVSDAAATYSDYFLAIYSLPEPIEVAKLVIQQ